MVAPGDPRATVWRLIRGPWQFAAVHALAELGCPASLAAGPLPVTELAARCDADPAALERLLRCAAGLGLLAQTAPGCYALTAAGRPLVPGTEGSLHPAVLATGDAAAWQAMTGLAASARHGRPAFVAQQGRGFYDYLAAHPARARIFTEFMASRSAGLAAEVARLDFPGQTVADIGGGSGTVLAAILAAHPHLRGSLFDREHVLPAARDVLAAAGVADRACLLAGDYLAGPLPPAGTYLLASILHNHDDAEARRILANIRTAATPAPGQTTESRVPSETPETEETGRTGGTGGTRSHGGTGSPGGTGRLSGTGSPGETTGTTSPGDTIDIDSPGGTSSPGSTRRLSGTAATGSTGRPRLLLADILLPDRPAPHIGCDLDVRMMALGTGRERTRAAYLALLRDAGFTATQVIGTPYGLSIIDASPAEPARPAHPR